MQNQDLQDDTSPVTIMKPLVAKLFSGEVVQLNFEEDEGFGKSAKIKNLTIEKIDFINPSEKKQCEKCKVCKIFLSENFNHCNLCGEAACKPCIRKSINDKSVCDICFMRQFMRSYSMRQKTIMASKKKQADELKKKTQDIQQKISSGQNQIKDISQGQQNQDDSSNILAQKDQEIELLQIKLDEKKSEHQNLQQEVETLQNELEEDLNTINKLQAQSTTLGTDIDSNEHEFELKNQAITSLEKQKNKMFNSKTYVKFQNEQQFGKTAEEAQSEQDKLLMQQKSQYKPEDVYAQNAVKPAKQLSTVTDVTEVPEKVSQMEQEKKNDSPEQCCCTIF